LTLAPVLVAWFDPETRRYQSVSSGSVTIRVDDPPRFDPSLIEVARLEEEPLGSREGWNPWISRVGIAGLGIILIGITWRTVRRWSRSPRRLAVRAARRLDAIEGPARADLAVAAVVGFLHLATDRPEGALTPPEAREAIAMLTNDPSLADRVKEMIETCDAVRYSGRFSHGQERRQLLSDAPAILRALAQARLDESRTGAGRSASGDNEPSE
jgi:hypothetical protein